MSSLSGEVERHYLSAKSSSCLSTPSIDVKSEVGWANRLVTPWSTGAELDASSLDDLYAAFCLGDKN